MIKTAHTEYDRLSDVFLLSPEVSFKSQHDIHRQWRSLNFLYEPSYEQALEEYKFLEKLISQSGCHMHYFPRASGLDDVYCRDASIATDYGMILCNMGKASRSKEPGLHRLAFESRQEKILGHIVSPGLLEGGDVAWINANTLAVGQGYRTNPEGLRQLNKILSPFEIELVPVELPHYQGPHDVFHLMSIFSPVDQNLAVVYSPLMPVNFRNLLLDRGYELVEVPDDEFKSMGCNVLAIAPRQCIIVAGNPVTKNLLEQRGCQVMEYPGEHLSLPGGGGPTCLTRPRWRIKPD